MTTPERHALAKQIFLEAIRQPIDERGRWLETACAADPSLRKEVEALLNQMSVESLQSAAASIVSGEPQPKLHTKVDVDSGAGSAAQPVSVQAIPAGHPAKSHELERQPGTMITDRYRIVSPLGVGGMGVVYRAEDLTLNQTVAMKFLPGELATNPLWLARLRNEARLARTVTHPNVCRVYDVGQADGAPFITMEFVPGEDLASLIRRIGRLPIEKAVEVARQICAGLAAAHRVGVLHRDLKPANIMLDADGNVRITDFGLAAVSGHVAAREIRAGTPAYMAPEQIAGRDVTWRSDLYALGLVLYELFSGSRAYSASSFEEYEQLHEHTTPRPLDEIVPDLPGRVEELILQCLEKTPEDRPGSALHVAAALPGVDVLRMSLTSGLTPLPDLIAVAPARSGGAHKRGLLVVLTLALLAGLSVLRTLYPLEWDDLGTIQPSALAERARRILEETDLSLGHAHESFGYSIAEDAWPSVARVFDPENSAANVVPAFPGEPCFFYRQSEKPFLPSAVENVFWRAGYATPDDPPLADARARAVLLDKRGQLILLGAAAHPLTSTQGSPSSVSADQLRTGLLRAAGVANPEALKPGMVGPSVAPNGSCANYDLPINEEDGRSSMVSTLCSSRQNPTFFAVGLKSDDANQQPDRLSQSARQQRSVILAQRILFLMLVAVVIPLGIAKSRMTRVNYQGAVRLAVFVVALELIAAMLRLGNAVSGFDAVSQLAMAVVRAAGVAGLVGVSYLAIDAYARRLWPHLLVTWSRLLMGRMRDPDVAYHALVGVCVGCWWSLAVSVERTAVKVAGWELRPMFSGERIAEKLHGTCSIVAGHLVTIERALVFGLLFMLLFVVIRKLIRQPVLAAMTCAVVLLPVIIPRGANPYTAWLALGLCGTVVCVWIMMRYGLLAITVALMVTGILNTSPMNMSWRTWTSGIGMGAAMLVACLIAYGFKFRQPRYVRERIVRAA